MCVGSASWGVVDLGYEHLKIGIDVEGKDPECSAALVLRSISAVTGLAGVALR